MGSVKNTILNFLPYGFVRALQREQNKETHINRALSKRGQGGYYVEIGVRDGTCFQQINYSPKVGIDPAPINFGDNLPDNQSFFKKPSDDFFEQDAKSFFGDKKVDVALVDGLHEFKQALNDIINLEPYMSGDGVIFVHDCNPPTRNHADVRDGGVWNGDVWKVAYYIRKYRPDLNFVTLNCDWGVGVITGFDKSAKTPLDDNLVNDCKNLDYDVLDKSRNEILQLKRAWTTRFTL